MFWLIGWIFFGFIVGLIARGLVPGKQPMGIFRTMMLGIGGSFLGGLIGFSLSEDQSFNRADGLGP